MKIVHVCYSDLDGGAARAAYRLHRAQRRYGLDSHMLVVNKLSDDPHVHAVSKARMLRIKTANFIAAKILALQKTGNTVHHSLNLFPSGILAELKALEPDVVNLHWIGGEMMSIGEVARIKQPIVWTLHDMWAFCGAEHYDHPGYPARYIDHYCSANRPSSDAGLDLDAWTQARKSRLWSECRIQLVAPSSWLRDCAKNSALFRNKSLDVIPNCIDHNVYKPLDTEFCRNLLSLPLDKKLVLFGAVASTSDPRKGYRYLVDAISLLEKEEKVGDIELVVFGASQGAVENEVDIKTHYLGKVHDDATLVALYNAADVFIAPSLQDNLPNTVVESLACGTQCVAFNIGGMPELIRSNTDGILAEEISSRSLAKAVSAVIESGPRFSPSPDSKSVRDEYPVSKAYHQLYEDISAA